MRDAVHNVDQRVSKTDLDGEAGALALVIEHKQVPIGDIEIWYSNREQRLAEIGWTIDPKYGGRGLATEAVRAGMRKEANFRQDWWNKGEWTDALAFAILASDFQAAR